MTLTRPRPRWALGLPALLAVLVAIGLGPFGQRSGAQSGPGRDASATVELMVATHPTVVGASGAVTLLANRGGGWPASPVAAVVRSGGWLTTPVARRTCDPVTDGDRLAGRGDVDQGRGPPLVDLISVS